MSQPLDSGGSGRGILRWSARVSGRATSGWSDRGGVSADRAVIDLRTSGEANQTREHEKRGSRANPSFSRGLLGGAHSRRLAMQVHAFRGRGRIFGFTANRSGDNLPAEHGPWVEFKTLDLVRGEAQAGVNVEECLDDIDEFGIHLTDAHVRITQ
jgi:hypothetical protein